MINNCTHLFHTKNVLLGLVFKSTKIQILQIFFFPNPKYVIFGFWVFSACGGLFFYFKKANRSEFVLQDTGESGWTMQVKITAHCRNELRTFKFFKRGYEYLLKTCKITLVVPMGPIALILMGCFNAKTVKTANTLIIVTKLDQ